MIVSCIEGYLTIEEVVQLDRYSIIPAVLKSRYSSI